MDNEKRVRNFLADGEGEIHWRQDSIQKRLLSGVWSQATLEGYNSAIAKVMQFAKAHDRSRNQVKIHYWNKVLALVPR